MPATTPAVPVPAATLLLLRDRPGGIEVLMMVRHDTVDFAGGAMVFPGGKVLAADAEVAASCRSARGDRAAILKIAAIRETYEECGILLARKIGSANVLSAADQAGIARSTDDSEAFAALLAERGLEPAIDLLVPLANWITPTMSPKRFNTHFFVANVSCDQVASGDGREAVEVIWMTPKAVAEEADADRRSVLPPTYLNLLKLAGCVSTDEALAVARATAIVAVTPELVRDESGPQMRIPEAAGYGITCYPAPKFLSR